MTQLKQSMLWLTIVLTFFYNIERLDFGFENLVDMSSAVYVMGFLGVAAMLLSPLMRRQNQVVTALVWGASYLAVRLLTLFATQRPVLGGVHTYLTITEIAFLMVLILVAQTVGRALDDFEEAVKNITLADLTHRVQHFQQAQDDIQKELLRSRRHQYPLSVMIFEPDSHSVNLALNRSVLDIQKAMMTRYAITNLLRMVSHMLRRTDLLVDQPEAERFIIVSPDTELASAEVVARRIQVAILQASGIKTHYGLAGFPAENLTFEELLERAEKKMQQQAALPATRPLSPDNLPPQFR